MNLLIVEDTYSKVKLIHEAFAGESVKPRIVHVISVSEALEAMRDSVFDVVVIDVQIPILQGDDIDVNGGIELLNQVSFLEGINSPKYIMGLTGYSENIHELRDSFAELGWLLFQSDVDKEKWIKVLHSKLALSNQSEKCLHADVAVITALEHTELEAVLAQNDDWDKKQIGGHSYYCSTIINSEGKEVSVVAASSERMGVSSCACVTTRVGMLFSPNLMFLSGICAGVREKVNLGDIIVADHVWNWESGKVISVEGELKHLPEPHQLPLSGSVRRIVNSYSIKCDFMYDIFRSWKSDERSILPKVVLAPMACGSQVVANGAVVEEIISQHQRKMLGLEMESYGFMSACESLGITGVVSKSVCDFADEEKSDDAQKYAAHTSAAFVFEMVKRHYGKEI